MQKLVLHARLLLRLAAALEQPGGKRRRHAGAGEADPAEIAPLQVGVLFDVTDIHPPKLFLSRSSVPNRFISPRELEIQHLKLLQAS